MRFLPVRLSIAAAAALAVSLAASCVAQDRHRRVAGWSVDDSRDEQGRLVEISRDGRSFSVSHGLSRLRGSAELTRGWSIRFGDCNSGDADPVLHVDADASNMLTARGRLAGYLAECGAPPAEIEAILGGFETAYPLFEEWAGRGAG